MSDTETQAEGECMRDDIVRKLREQLAQEVGTECQVVYILCEARKLMEKYGASPDLLALKLYCHWALHIDLCGKDTVGPFLERIDQFMYDSFDPNGHGVSPANQEAIRELVYLDSFRNQFRRFLEAYELPNDICSNDGRWGKFLAAYSKVIEDGSLIWKVPTVGLKMIRGMTFTRKSMPPGTDSRNAFTIGWDILLRDGKTLALSLHSNQTLIGSIAHVRQ
jgi:hypothetical protein